MSRLTILLCTHNGATWLPEQLASYRAQSDTDWDLWVSDDGSTDGTRAVLQRFADEVAGQHAVRLIEGPQRGLAANFLSLIAHPDLPQGPVALSDQDDVWLPGKLSRARAGLATAGPVALYGARLTLTDAGLRPVGALPALRRAASFRNALTQNVVPGLTAALSPGAVALVRRAGVTGGVPYHDWFLSQLITGAGGEIVSDIAEVALYRQHAHNAMGAHHGAGATLARMGQVLGTTYGGWIRDNLTALHGAKQCLTQENAALVTRLHTTARGPLRALAFARAGLHRQSPAASAALYAATLLGRV